MFTSRKCRSESCKNYLAINTQKIKVKVPQKVVAGLSTTINFDFSKTDKWRFDCKYGLQVPQYSYFPPENEQKTEEE
jgi:hypothetical protein